MKENVDISFIVPVYNSEVYLPRCLDSILSQKGITFEIIVVNDGSPGKCDEVIESYTKKSKFIKYIKHNANRSLMQARLSGIELAIGKYVLHVDSDDWISDSTGKLALGVAKSTGADVVQFGMYHGACSQTMYPHFSNRVYSLDGDDIRKMFLNGELWWTQAGKLFKRSVVLEAFSIFPLNKDLHINSLEDLALTFPIILMAKKYVSNPKSGSYFYYNNPASMTKNLVVNRDRWNKLCYDLRTVRGFVHEISNSRSDVDNEKLDKLLHLNYEWALSLLDELPKSLRVDYMKELNGAFSTPLIVELLPLKKFSDFAESIIFTESKTVKPKKIQRVCFISEVLHSGGAERATSLLMEMMSKEGYDLFLITDEIDQNKDLFQSKNLSRFSLPKKKSQRWVKIQDIISEQRIDLCIHISHYRNEMMFDILALSDKCWNIAVEHSMYFFPFYKPDMTLFNSRLAAYKRADAVVCLSELNKKWWQASGIKSVKVIPNPLTFLPGSVQQSDGQKKNLVFVGRLCEMKGALTVLQVFNLVCKKHSDARLYFLGRYGSENDRKIIESFIKSNKLEGQVIVKGHVENVSSYFQDAKMHLMTSLIEGAPMVLAEAKSHGVPSILMGLPYLDNIGETNGSLVVNKGDIDGMANLVSELLENHHKWHTLSIASKNSISDFSNVEVMSNWSELIQKLPHLDVLNAKLDKDEFLSLTMSELMDGLEYALFNAQDEFKGNAEIPSYLMAIDSAIGKIVPRFSRRRAVLSYIYKAIMRMKRR